MRYFCPTPFPPVVPPMPPFPETTTQSSGSDPTTTTTTGPTTFPPPTVAQIGAGAALGIFFGVAVVCVVVAGTVYYCFFMNNQQRQIFRTAFSNFFRTGSFFGRFPRSPRRYRPNPREMATLEPIGHPSRDVSQPEQQSNPGSNSGIADLQDWVDTRINPYIAAYNSARQSDLSISARTLRFRSLSEPELSRYPTVPTHDPNLDEPEFSDQANPETGLPQVPSQPVSGIPSQPNPARLYPFLPAQSHPDLKDPASFAPSQQPQPVVPQPMGRPPSYSTLPHNSCPSQPVYYSPPPVQLLYGPSPSQPVFYSPQTSFNTSVYYTPYSDPSDFFRPSAPLLNISQSPHLRPVASLSPDPGPPENSTFTTVLRPHTIFTSAEVYPRPGNVTSSTVEPSFNPSGTVKPSSDPSGSSSTLSTLAPLFESTRNDILDAGNEDESTDNLFYSTAEDFDLTSTFPSSPLSKLSDKSIQVSFSSSSSSSVNTDVTENNVDVTVLPAMTAAATNKTDVNKTQDDDADADPNGTHDADADADETDDNLDETIQISLSSSSSSTFNLSSSSYLSDQSVKKAQSCQVSSDADLSILQNEVPEHQEPPVVPPAFPSSAPASPTGRRRLSSASAATPRSASSKSLNRQRWLKGQGIDSANILEGKRIRKPKQK